MQDDACALPFPDEHFDAVTNNYCYHNIPSKDRQAIILENLRILKKGGTFAIHDEFTKRKYGDTAQLVQKLQDLGYEKVELLDTSDGLFMTRQEARPLCLVGSALLVGKKQKQNSLKSAYRFDTRSFLLPCMGLFTAGRC